MEHFAPLNWLDWLVIFAFFAVVIGIGLYFAKRATGSMTEYFVAGRKMTWWLAGTSIVATSFAADTPLVIAGWMRTYGLERNWFWWGGIMGMMLCTFFFARLWRRANIITDVSFNELRYSGLPAAGLRMFHASYRSIIQNTIIMGWVTLAMTKILDVTLSIPTLVFLKGHFLPTLVAKGLEVSSVIDMSLVAHWPVIGLAIIPAKATGIIVCMTIAAIYVTVSGAWGLMTTDFFQFCFAMTGVIVLMVFTFMVAGGPTQLVTKAYDAVTQGVVINKAPLKREVVPTDPLLLALGEKSSKKPDEQVKQLQSSAQVQELLSQGLVRWNAATNQLVWSANGLTEQEVEQRIKPLKLPGTTPFMTLWKKAYTMSVGSFTDFQSVSNMIAGGIMIQDTLPGGKKAEYFRLPNATVTEEQLRADLNKAAVENKSEIMAAWRDNRVVTPVKITNFLPPFDLKGGGLVAIWSLIVFLGLQWWAGGEGGGFLAQRLFSCKNEKHSVLAMLWFNLANYALRPWPWIVVGVGSLFLIPDVTVFGPNFDQEHAYVIMFMKFLPVGLKGLLLAALIAAYMSTIASHINFGASYVVNDLYRRFVHKSCSEAAAVTVSRIASVILAILAAIYAYKVDSIGDSWLTLFELMSGAGFVVLLRWYWWRISAYSELAAMFSSLFMFWMLNKTQVFQTFFGAVGLPLYLLDEYAVRFSINLICSTIIWVTVTFLTPPEKEEHLIGFYKRIRPAGWWKKIAIKAGHPNHLNVGWIEWSCWGLGVTGLFSFIVSLGKACFGMYGQSLAYGLFGILASYLIFVLIGKMDWSGMESSETSDSSTPSDKAAVSDTPTSG
jgi:Na+/proline symporter